MGVTTNDIDAVDREILRALQDGSRTTNAEIARSLEMAPSAILERIRKLEARGVVTSYAARLDPRAVDLGLLAFVFVKVAERPGEETAGRRIAEHPNVLEVHHIAGEDCYLVKVRVADTSALGELLRQGLGSIEAVASTRTTIVLETIKETAVLPVAEGEAP